MAVPDERGQLSWSLPGLRPELTHRLMHELKKQACVLKPSKGWEMHQWGAATSRSSGLFG